MSPATRPALAAFALLGLTFLAYAPAFHAGFVWDDDDYVTQNRLLHDADGLRRIWTTAETPQYYPLVFTSFWIEHRLWGLDPAGYHAVNVALHALNALLVYALLRELGIGGAFWVAALFALHPVHVESVAWITERKNVLSGLFYLAAFASYLRSDRSGRRLPYGLALVAFACAMLSKTVTASLPVALGLALLWRRGRIARADVLRLAPFFALGLALALVTLYLERGMVDVVGREFDFAWWQRLLVASGALLFYPWKIVWPAGLTFNYPRWDLAAGLAPLVAAALVVLAAAGALAWAWRRGRHGVVLAAAFYGVTIFPALGFLDVYPFRYSFVADHFQYLASLGPLMLIVAAAIVLDRGVAHRLAWPAGRAAVVCGLAALGVLAALTWRQTGAYHDLETLWEHTLRRNPSSWLALNNLGLMRLDAGDAAAARELLDRAVAARPRSAESHTARGLARARLGDVAGAREDLDRAVELDPTYPQARLNRGDVLLEHGRPEAAIDDFSHFLGANPGYLPARRARARALLAAGRPAEALADLDAIVRDGPTLEAFTDRALAEVNLGRFGPAVEDFTRALALRPDSAPALAGRAFAQVRLGRSDLALQDLDRAAELDPRQVQTFLLRGAVRDARGDAAGACADWSRACELGNCGAYRARCGAG